MNEERAKRKLSGILSADAVGYSRLMQKDEAATIVTLAESKELMANLIQQYRGRVVDAPGDNLLAEFASVVDATECAAKIQQELKLKNAQLPDNHKMQFRIGVNLGDVVEEADRIYGDGVNIAARLEGLAEPGGICISRTAYDHVKNKLELGYEYRGEHSVKNIAEPVRVYRILMEPEAAGKVIGEKRFLGRISRRAAIATIIALIIVAGGVIGWNIHLHQSKRIEPASIEKMAYPLPDTPSIAVLPFVNMSEDKNQELFSGGLTEEIITALSKGPNLFVIASTSTFTYKGKAVKVKQVSEELGVRYVLEGSVHRSGDRIRINAQLIDALKGYQLWSERYDRDLKDFFVLQDEITMKIITALRVKLTSGEMVHVLAKGAKNIDAFTKYLQAVDLWTHLTKETNAQAKKLLEEAVVLDPEYPGPYIGLAKTYGIDVMLGATKSPDESLTQAFKFAQKAISLDNTNGAAYSVLSWLYATRRQFDKAIAESERAVSLNPSSAESYMRLSLVLAYAGRGEEGIPYMKKALRLNPFPSHNYFSNFGIIYRESGHYEKAIEVSKKALESEPNAQIPYITLAISYIRLGQEEEARSAAAEILRINPKFSVNRYAKVIPFTQPLVDRIVEDLRKAGLK